MSETKTRRGSRMWNYAKSHLRDVIVAALILAAFVVGYSISSGDGSKQNNASSDAGTTTKAQWYTCSMHPDVRMPNPDDKCPICHMSLIPVTSDSGDSALGPRQIKLSPAAQAMIDVQTTPVVRRFIERDVNMVGQVEYDETRLAYITAYVDGRLDRLFVDYTGIEVRKGDHLTEIYSPELIVGLKELNVARNSMDELPTNASEIVKRSAQSLLSAARERLELLGLTKEQINAAEAGNFKGDHITLYAPVEGVVISKNAKQGSYVKEGDRIYTIADLKQVWVILEAYESDLPWLRFGQRVTFKTQAFGDKTFEGTIAFIAPTLDKRQRTVRVRVNVKNETGQLRPGMFVRAKVRTEIASEGKVISPELEGKWISPMHPEVVTDKPGDCPVCGMKLVKAEELGYAGVNKSQMTAPLVVPETAVLRTGERGIVYVKTNADSGKQFEGRTVTLGPRGDGFFIIESGLQEGDIVVTRGNFQIDSALQIQAKSSMMNPPADEKQSEPKVHLHGDAAKPIASLIDSYLALSAALAGDEEAKANRAISTLKKNLFDANQAKLPDGFASLWDEISDELDNAVEDYSNSEKIDALRKRFGEISKQIIALVERSHIDSVVTLYEVHCPMAFDFTGASWLDSQDRVLNPYFGDRMLKCGTVKQTFVAEAAHQAPASQPATTKPQEHRHE